MHKKNFTNFELPDFKLVKELRTKYENFMIPENLSQFEELKKHISDNKEHFDHLKEIYEQLYSELIIFFSKEMSHPRELTKAHLKKEYKSFQETEIYVELSEKIDALSPKLNKIEQTFLIQSTFILSIYLKLSLNSDKLFKILEILIYIFISKQNLNNLIANTCLYSDIISMLCSSSSKDSDSSQK